MTQLTVPQIVDFSKSSPEVSVSQPPPDRLLRGTPEQRASNFFSDASGRFFAGIWESSPGRWRVRYSENEFCHITRGKVRIESTTGESWTFASGASFVIPSGFEGTWEVLEPTAKLYAIYEPAT